jgi:hypothetical protein
VDARLVRTILLEIFNCLAINPAARGLSEAANRLRISRLREFKRNVKTLPHFLVINGISFGTSG